VALYNVSKLKPVTVIKDAHSSGWVSALACTYNTDMIVSGGMDDHLNFYQVAPAAGKIEKKFSIRCVGKK
jgi:hypothetical protein